MMYCRRGFIGGLGALLASPAIVRASSIMPVRVWDRYVPGRMLTPSIIAEEFSRLVHGFVGRPAEASVPFPLMQRQSHIDTSFGDADLLRPLENFSDRFLRPAADTMARHISMRGGSKAARS